MKSDVNPRRAGGRWLRLIDRGGHRRHELGVVERRVDHRAAGLESAAPALHVLHNRRATSPGRLPDFRSGGFQGLTLDSELPTLKPAPMADPPSVRLTVPPEAAGLRLDRFVAGSGRGWSRSQVARWIEAGRVTRNGRPAKAAQLLSPGDEVEVAPPAPVPSELRPEAIPLDVLFEDRHMIVVNKPPGLVIHPAAGNPDGTLVNALLAHCRDLSGIGGVERPGIVHRLDKDTSGVLVAAKSDAAHRALSLAFRWRTTDKRYLAVVYGAPKEDEGVVDAPIARHPSERKRMAVVRGGRPARTLWWVRERLTGTALVECRPVTGRTHQIRVHLAHVGHALVGDPVYAGRQWRAIDDPVASPLCRDFPRQALHAWRLTITHPASGEAMTFEAPLPEDMKALVEALRRGPS
jgi:23S rRNA pseudouridine1911/1915/1917 synthase